MIIAIDGPAASGKGTLGKKLAAHFGLRHLDTGLLYRAVAKTLMDAGQPCSDVAKAAAAAQISTSRKFGDPALKDRNRRRSRFHGLGHPQVREALVSFQRQFAAEPPGAVMDGRDIGTVICPDADVKIFVMASPEVRARRRTRKRRAGRGGG